MKTKKRFFVIRLIILFSASIFTGCSSQSRCEKKLTKLEAKCPDLFRMHDSIFTRVVTKESVTHDTILLPGAANTFTITLPCPEKFTQNKYFKQGTATAKLSNGVLTVSCPEDSLMEIITDIRDSVKVLTNQTQTGMATRTVTQYINHWYTPICNWVTIIILIALIIFIIYLILRVWFSLPKV